MIQIERETAIKIAESGIWRTWTDEQIVRFQLYQDRLCMDFDRYHEAIENVLNRSVWTHEFADMTSLRAEYEKKKPAPTFDEIMAPIMGKEVIIVVG